MAADIEERDARAGERPACAPAGGLGRVRVGALGTNCYLVDDGLGGCVVVDPGADAPAILRALDGRSVTLVLVTHAHFDHVGALADIAPLSAGGWCVGAPDAERALAGDPSGAHMLGLPAARPCTVAPRRLADGDVVRAGELAFRVIACPGHSAGGVTYVVDACGLAFTGDTLFAGSAGRTDLGGDDAALAASLTRLAQLPGEYRVLPGHGPGSTIARELAENPYLR